MSQSVDFGAALAVAAEAQGVSYELIPVGKYNATITKSEVKTAKSGATMLYVELDITDPGAYQGKKLFHNFVFPEPGAEKAAERWQYFFNDMDVLGLPREWFAQVGLTDLQNVANVLVGRSANVETKHAVQDGTTYCNIKRWRKVSVAPVVSGVPQVPGAPASGAAPVPPAPVPGGVVPTPAAPAVPPVPGAPAPSGIPAPPPPPFAA